MEVAELRQVRDDKEEIVPRKIKNPEKLIQRLKKRVLELEIAVTKPNPHKGWCKVNWKDGIIDEQGVSDQSLGAFNPGDLVVITGIVKEIDKRENSSWIRYERKQTKLVQAIE